MLKKTGIRGAFNPIIIFQFLWVGLIVLSFSGKAQVPDQREPEKIKTSDEIKSNIKSKHIEPILPSVDDTVHVKTLVQGVRKLAQKFKISGYGIMNYYGNDWKTDTNRRNNVDIERMVFYPSLIFSPKIRLDAEIEFEHLGAGVTMSYDPFEEFGEFEQEVTKGGSIVVERINLCVEPTYWFKFRIGRVIVPYGLVSKRHRPRTYFTTTRSEVEYQLCPTNWYENGIEFFGSIDKKAKWNYHLLLIGSLDASGFSSANFIKRGHQKRFEMQNVEDLTIMGRLDYEFLPNSAVGFSGLYGNTQNNRPRKDLYVPAYVGVFDAHAFIEYKNIKARGLVLLGTLENSEAVSIANRKLSNNLGAKRTPVGSMALGAFIEAGYNVMSFLDKKAHTQLDVFARYDYYDSMFQTEGVVFNNPRWERNVYTVGINYQWFYQITFKLQYSVRKFSIPTMNQDNTFSFGLGYEF